MPKPNMSNLGNKTAKFLTQFKKKHHRRASAVDTRRFQRKLYLNRIRHTQRADFRRKYIRNMPNELMENEDMGSYMSAPGSAPGSAPAAAAEINELREMRRRAQIKRAKEKAEQKAKQAKITAKARATRATRKALEEEQAKSEKMAMTSKKLAIKEGRAARAAGNVAGADAMEDEIREEIREQEANKGNTGLEDIFKNLGL